MIQKCYHISFVTFQPKFPKLTNHIISLCKLSECLQEAGSLHIYSIAAEIGIDGLFKISHVKYFSMFLIQDMRMLLNGVV